VELQCRIFISVGTAVLVVRTHGHYYSPVERFLVESLASVISCDVRAATARRVSEYRDAISVTSCEVMSL
jgi:tetrahydromethanopterin S-methyltransferase subunit C